MENVVKINIAGTVSQLVGEAFVQDTLQKRYPLKPDQFLAKGTAIVLIDQAHIKLSSSNGEEVCFGHDSARPNKDSLVKLDVKESKFNNIDDELNDIESLFIDAVGDVVVSSPDDSSLGVNANTILGSSGVFSVDNTGHWTYLLDEEAAAAMLTGEVKTETFTVRLTNGIETKIKFYIRATKTLPTVTLDKKYKVSS